MREMLELSPPRTSGRFVAGNQYSRATQFRPGERTSPRTEIKRGERRGIATEFKSGAPANNRLRTGTVTIRRETHTQLQRAWIKVAEPNVWKKRAVVVWESIHGPLQQGFVVHHHDRDSLNDDPSNLRGMTKRDHINEHRGELKC